MTSNRRKSFRHSTRICVKNIPAKLHPDPIWNDRALGFFEEEEEDAPQHEEEDEYSNMGSVPDPQKMRLATCLLHGCEWSTKLMSLRLLFSSCCVLRIRVYQDINIIPHSDVRHLCPSSKWISGAGDRNVTVSRYVSVAAGRPIGCCNPAIWRQAVH